MSWLNQSMFNNAYEVEYPNGRPGPGAKEAAGAEGVPQAAPPVVPATIEQQQNNSSAAVQYGGATPYAKDARVDTNALWGVGLAVVGFWMYLRMRE